MDFSRRKLPPEAAETLRARPVREVAAYSLLFAPAYVFLRRNDKFVAVKGPLDFFTPEDLAKLERFEQIYFPQFIDQVEPFAQAGRRARAILARPAYLVAQPSSKRPPVALDPPPFVSSDEILRIVGPLWHSSAGGAEIEPFFAAAFVDEACARLPGELLRDARDGDVDAYEAAALRSSWAVFSAMHLGYVDSGFLDGLRLEVFRSSLGLDVKPTFVSRPFGELAQALVASGSLEPVRAADLSAGSGELQQRFSGRVQRILSLATPALDRASIHGKAGFLDV